MTPLVGHTWEMACAGGVPDRGMCTLERSGHGVVAAPRLEDEHPVAVGQGALGAIPQ